MASPAVFDSESGYLSTVFETPRDICLIGIAVQVRFERKALLAVARPTCCSGSRATICTGICG